MIEIYKTIPNPEKIQSWLEQTVLSSLTPDISNYAKGRLRLWLDKEPMLFAPFDLKPAFPISEKIKNRLKEIIEWDWDFCLVTYSGDEGIGIAPHMDAGYADFEARTIHISGECKFDYWQSRNTFGRSPNIRNFKVEQSTGVVSEKGIIIPATTSLILPLGAVTKFNCKCPHSATPSPKRWNLNFWRKKP